jgi:hypothetical protein
VSIRVSTVLAVILPHKLIGPEGARVSCSGADWIGLREMAENISKPKASTTTIVFITERVGLKNIGFVNLHKF